MNINKDILYDKHKKIINREDFNNSIANDMTYNKIKNSVISYQLLF